MGLGLKAPAWGPHITSKGPVGGRTAMYKDYSRRGAEAVHMWSTSVSVRPPIIEEENVTQGKDALCFRSPALTSTGFIFGQLFVFKN